MPESTKHLISICDPIFTSLFLLELCLKVIAYGLEGYLNDTWNRVDFVCVVLSLIALPGLVPASIARVMRTGRTVRPLRMVNKNPRIQMIFTALFKSLPAVGNVLVLAFFAMMIYAIMGMSFFSGLFNTCNDGDAAGKLDCFGIVSGGGEEGAFRDFMIPYDSMLETL